MKLVEIDSQRIKRNTQKSPTKTSNNMCGMWKMKASSNPAIQSHHLFNEQIALKKLRNHVSIFRIIHPKITQPFECLQVVYFYHQLGIYICHVKLYSIFIFLHNPHDSYTVYAILYWFCAVRMLCIGAFHKDEMFQCYTIRTLVFSWPIVIIS